MSPGFLTEAEIEKMFAALHEEQGPVVAKVKFKPLQPVNHPPAGAQGIESLGDVKLSLVVELGSTKLSVKEVLELNQGSIIELERLAGEPVEISFNDSPFAKGEVVVINEVFGVRITELVNEENKEKQKG